MGRKRSWEPGLESSHYWYSTQCWYTGCQGLLLAFKEASLTWEYRPAILISSVPGGQGIELNSLPLHQRISHSSKQKVSLVPQELYSYAPTKTIVTPTELAYMLKRCSCSHADKQKSTTHRSSKLLHAYVFSSSSNHTQASRSRWFVGSSSSSMKGRMKSALQGQGR